MHEALFTHCPPFQEDPVECGLSERSDESNYCEEALIR